ncbi:Uncharacterized protein FKW44_013589 [Caligus rogercresseyi]|uniref:Uncharacterized protein n=1 Tax=Caligus rogercresseyi TaxID=217165 RepID=A0A7T8GYF0_CALRO|nr:Uncharacterized protein FKW44_013589 [Caligus rogercresseyi]
MTLWERDPPVLKNLREVLQFYQNISHQSKIFQKVDGAQLRKQALEFDSLSAIFCAVF